MLNFDKKYIFGLGAAWALATSSMFMGKEPTPAPTIIPDPTRPMTIHREMLERYPEYAARLKQLGVDYQRPNMIEANSYQRDKSQANSITYRIGACRNLRSDWKESLMNSFPGERGDMKYARYIAGVPSSPEDHITGNIPGHIGVNMPGGNTFLINASGFKKGVYDTTYISIECESS
ncbi:MAG: hypothetical protein H6855_03645 [Rhodospirillales bacterium]|nr:hypothetical protein [Rhodospirillales bacterium]MCB9979566.1 hypothetical protein [Rhodospirillales bacterium]